MRSAALSALLSVVALASALATPRNYCEQQEFLGYAQQRPSSSSASTVAPSNTPSSTPVSAAASTPIVLSPIVPPNINQNSLEHVAPTIDEPTSLYFQGSGGDEIGYSAVTKANFNAPSVMIDHCGYADAVYSDGQLIVKFTSPEGYTAAKNQWGVLNELYILTHTPGCGNYADGEYCFFSATKFSYDDRTTTITCYGAPKLMNEVVDTYQVDFGHGDPGEYFGLGKSTDDWIDPNGDTGNNQDTANFPPACHAPVDDKFNLPTACLGPYFDGDIDDIIGYEDGTQSSWASKVQNSIHTVDSDDLPGNGHALSKKRFNFGSAFSSLGSSIGNGFKSFGSLVNNAVIAPAAKTAQQIGTAVKQTGETVGNAVKQTGEKAVNAVKQTGETAVNAVKQTGEQVGNGVQQTGQQVGNGIVHTGQQVGNGIVQTGQQVGNGIVQTGQQVGNGVQQTGQQVGNGIVQTGQRIGNAIKQTGQKIGNGAKELVTEKIIPAITNLGIEFSLGSRTVEFQVPRDQKVDKDAPWPNARLLYRGRQTELSKELTSFGKGKENAKTDKGKNTKLGGAVEAAVSVHCVDCGVKGRLKFSGTAKIGFTSLDFIVLDTEMDLTTSMYAGISGNIDASLPISTELASIPMTPIVIPPFIEIGPVLSVSIDMIVKVGLADAKILAGGTLIWKGARARLGFNKGTASSSNWTPEFKPTLNASGEFSVGLDFGLPIELLIGVTAQSKKASVGFAIEARPGIETKASIAGSISKTSGSGFVTTVGDEECPFIKTGIDLKFDCGLSVRVGESVKIPLKTIAALRKPIHKGCITSGGKYQSLLNPRHLIDRQLSPTDSKTIPDFLNATQLINTTLEAIANHPIESFMFPAIPSTAYNDTNGTSYISLYDLSQTFLLTSCGNGNLYMQLNENLTALAAQGCGTLFAYETSTDLIYADGSSQLFYFYTDEMAITGVSRLRHSAIENVPLNTEYVSFAPKLPQVDPSSSPDDQNIFSDDDPIYVAKTSDGTYYATTVCFYADPTLPPKIFLISDLEWGIEMLKSPDVKYSITGGDVTDCLYLPLTNGNAEPDGAWSGVANNLAFEEDWVEDWSSDDI
ncbi:unnamed protein product [Periconia digitata]|uniref:Uncharacterized protein n=1 Tax=Periconia digitata TaxID=1303443 RepID=A0A9W4XLC4_9PLEO|nr:unnamed protein product [Periconia digitata]